MLQIYWIITFLLIEIINVRVDCFVLLVIVIRWIIGYCMLVGKVSLFRLLFVIILSLVLADRFDVKLRLILQLEHIIFLILLIYLMIETFTSNLIFPKLLISQYWYLLPYESVFFGSFVPFHYEYQFSHSIIPSM